MILRVPRPGVDAAGLARLQVFVDQAADELQVSRPTVTVDLDQVTPNAHAAGSGRDGAWVEASPALTAAPEPVQRWFAAHEVGHLQLAATLPLRTALTGRASLVWCEAAAVVVWAVTSVHAPLLGIAAVGLLPSVLCAWLACSQHEEYTADRLAARVLRARGEDPVQGTKAVMDQSWFGPRGPGVMARVSTHPTAERRLAAVQREQEGCR